MQSEQLLKKVGRAIRDRRRSLDLSLLNVATMLGASPTHLSMIERGMVPHVALDKINEIAQVLDIKLTALFPSDV